MKDFPFFTTDNGVASLTLRQIPYRGEAYITLQSGEETDRAALIRECADFCRIAGAKRVFLNHPEGPLRVLELRGVPNLDPEKVENIFPVTRETAGKWRAIVNDRMAGVDLARTLEARDETAIVDSGGAYFIHRDGTLLGVGWLQEGTLRILASLVPGMGERVAHTLLSVTPGESIRIEVASSNRRALRLYEKLGFLKVRQLEAWEEIL